MTWHCPLSSLGRFTNWSNLFGPNDQGRKHIHTYTNGKHACVCIHHVMMSSFNGGNTQSDVDRQGVKEGAKGCGTSRQRFTIDRLSGPTPWTASEHSSGRRSTGLQDFPLQPGDFNVLLYTLPPCSVSLDLPHNGCFVSELDSGISPLKRTPPLGEHHLHPGARFFFSFLHQRHGGNAFCLVASWLPLQPFVGLWAGSRRGNLWGREYSVTTRYINTRPSLTFVCGAIVEQ